MNTQQQLNDETLAKIAEALRAVVDTWPGLKCTECGAVRPHVINGVEVDWNDHTFEVDKKAWRVRGLQHLASPGWVEVSVEGADNSSTRSVFCPTCAKKRIL